MALTHECHGAEEGGRQRWQELRGLVAPRTPLVSSAHRLLVALCDAEKIFTTSFPSESYRRELDNAPYHGKYLMETVERIVMGHHLPGAA